MTHPSGPDTRKPSASARSASLQAVVWSERFATRHAGIDGQHRMLFKLLERASAGLGQPQRSNYRQIVLDLFKYIVEHFAYEHDLMRASAYPDRARHDADHQRLIAQALAFKDRILAGQNAEHEFAGFLTGWVEQHIGSKDAGLARHLTG